MTKKPLNKAQRLVIERDLKALGLLDGYSMHQIAAAFGVNVAQISRDFRDLEDLEVAAHDVVRALVANDQVEHRTGPNLRLRMARLRSENAKYGQENSRYADSQAST